VNATVRHNRGTDIDAACGQLAGVVAGTVVAGTVVAGSVAPVAISRRTPG
jgi:hypothetical protein